MVIAEGSGMQLPPFPSLVCIHLGPEVVCLTTFVCLTWSRAEAENNCSVVPHTRRAESVYQAHFY